ncbi:MAG: hypothetical protein ACTSYA_07725 [Candidatus Kariarchaeaceae archaeon]
MTEQEDEKRQIYDVTRESGIELLNTLTMNLHQEVMIIRGNIGKELTKEIEEQLAQLDQRNDHYSLLIQQLLLQGIFLAVNSSELQHVSEGFEKVIEKVECVAYRQLLIPLPEWVNDHIGKLLDLLLDLLNHISFWFQSEREINPSTDLIKIKKMEDHANELHRKFIKKIFKDDLEVKVFSQAEFLAQTARDGVIEVQKLAQRIYIVLHNYKLASKPLPSYLA